MQHMIIPQVLALRHIQYLMAKILSWHVCLFIQIMFIFSQLVTVSLETDRIRSVDHHQLSPEFFFFFFKFVINIWNKCHLIKWPKMQQYDIKKGCAKTFWEIKRNCITYLNLEILIFLLRPTATSDTQIISWIWEWINFSDTQKYVLLSKIMSPQIHWY